MEHSSEKFLFHKIIDMDSRLLEIVLSHDQETTIITTSN